MGYVYIAKRHDGKTLGIVIALTEQLANVYWQGQGITPHSVEVRELLANHPTGVIPIYKTKEINSRYFNESRKDFFLVEDNL